MIRPPGWYFKRPGIIIPVFFLSLFQGELSGQVPWNDAASAALGGTIACSQGYMSCSQNQAGLGFIDNSSVTIQHGRPYLLKELGISSLAAQFRSGMGALGLSLSTLGLKGFRQSSLWLACGLRIQPGLSAGLGIHFWSSSLAEQAVYAPGASFALGLQIRIQEQWMLGARLFHPASWTSISRQTGSQKAAIEIGISYSFFRVARLFSELHIKHGSTPILCSGLEWSLKSRAHLRTGFCSRPFTFSWGISMQISKWVMEFSFRYWTDTGLAPQSAMTYVW